MQIILGTNIQYANDKRSVSESKENTAVRVGLIFEFVTVFPAIKVIMLTAGIAKNRNSQCFAKPWPTKKLVVRATTCCLSFSSSKSYNRKSNSRYQGSPVCFKCRKEANYKYK